MSLSVPWKAVLNCLYRPTKGTMESYWKMACSVDESGGKASPGRGKMKPAVMALRINKGEKGLSLYGNGKLVDKLVASTSPDSEHTCLVGPNLLFRIKKIATVIINAVHLSSCPRGSSPEPESRPESKDTATLHTQYCKVLWYKP